MALVHCLECNHLVSDSAKTCPSCGAQVKRKSKVWRWVIGAPVIFALAFVLAVYIFVRVSEANIRDAALEATGHLGDPRFSAVISKWGKLSPAGSKLVCVFVTDAGHGGDIGTFVLVEVDSPFERIIGVMTESNDTPLFNGLYDMACT